MDAPDRHDTMVEATALAQTNEYESYHQGVVICSYLIVAVVACIAARDVAVQRAAHTGGVSPDLVGAAAGKDGVREKNNYGKIKRFDKRWYDRRRES